MAFPSRSDHGTGKAALEQAVHRIETFFAAAGLAALHEGREALPFPDLEKDGPPDVAQELQTRRAHLEHQGLGVAVHHEARQAIPLPEDPAAAALGVPQTQLLPQGQGRLEALPEEGLVQGRILEAEDPRRQRARGARRAHAHHLARMVGQSHQMGLRGLGQGPGEDPGVALGEQGLLAGFQAKHGIGPTGSGHRSRLA